MGQLKLDVVVPCYEEQEGVARFHEELTAVLDHLVGTTVRILYIDDGSTDHTLDILNGISQRDPRAIVYSFTRNFGHQMALTAGLQASDADIVIMMDSDLQHPPALIPALWERHREGYDIVSAVRQDTRDASWFKKSTSHAFYRVVNWLSDTQIVPGAADFCLLSRRARKVLTAMPENHRFLRGMIAWTGFPRAYVPYVAPPRHAGKSSYSLWRMIRFAMDAVFSFSTKPIRLILKMGLAATGIGLCYLCYEILRYFLRGDAVRGWPSLMALVSVFGGLQMLAIAVSGEYLARVFETSKRRPLYVFKQEPGASGCMEI